MIKYGMENRYLKADTYFMEGCGRCSLGGTPDCKVHRWTSGLTLLRNIILECGLTEEIKWSVPCYTYKNKNILILAAFKDYFSISFFKGFLLKDEFNLLQKPGENTMSARVWKFTDTPSIVSLKSTIKEYILEAVELENSGNTGNSKPTHELVLPEEFLAKLNENEELNNAFKALSPGRQRGYCLYFSAAKQSHTRKKRIEKSIPFILKGKGIHD